MLKRTPQLIFKGLIQGHSSVKAFPTSSINWLPKLNLKNFTPLFQVPTYHFTSNTPRQTEYKEENLAIFYEHEPERVPEFRKVMEKYIQCKDSNLLAADEIELISEVLGNIGIFYTMQGNQEQGQRYLKESEDLERETGAKENINLATNFYLQGIFNLRQNNLSEAQRYLTEADRICRLFIDQDPDAKSLLVQICCYSAQLCHQQKDHDQALKLYQSVIERSDDICEEEKARMIIMASQTMGYIYESRYDIEKAAENYIRCLDTEIKYSGEKTRTAHAFAQQLSNFFYEKKQFEKALPFAKQAHKIASQTLPQDHPVFPLSLLRIASIYEKQEKLSEALASFKEAIQSFENQQPQDAAPYLLECYFKSGKILALQGSPQEASNYLVKAGSFVASTMKGKELADKYFELATELNFIGNVMEVTESYFLKAVEIYESMEDSHLTSYTYIFLFSITFPQENMEKALKYAKKAESYFAKGGIDINDMQTIYSALSTLSVNFGNLEDGLKYSQKALECHKTTRNRKGLSGAHFTFAMLREREGKFEEALQELKTSLEFQEPTGPSARTINEKILEIERKLQGKGN